MSLRIRRGGASVGADASIFGPTLGAQSVRDDAGPRSVVDPGGGIPFNNASNLNTLIDANPANSTFVGAGNQTYNITSSIRDFNKNPTIIFLPGAIVQGSATYGSHNTILGTSGDGPATTNWGGKGFIGTIRGGLWRHFAVGIQIGSGGVVEDVDVQWCWQAGVYVFGFDPIVRYSWLHHNGVEGLFGFGWEPNSLASFPAATGSPSGTPWIGGSEVHHNEVSFNHQRKGEAGNGGDSNFSSTMKFVWRENDWVHHNWFHHNFGFGIWWDVYNRGNPAAGIGKMLCEENVSEFNDIDGIYYEISWGPMVLRHNYSAFNGAFQLHGRGVNVPTIVNALNYGGLVEVHNNLLYAGPIAMSYGVLNWSSPQGQGHCINLSTHHNDMWSERENSAGSIGLDAWNTASPGDGTIAWNTAPARNVTFDFNSYHVRTAMTQPFVYGDGRFPPGDGWQTWAQWQAAGRDANGSLVIF